MRILGQKGVKKWAGKIHQKLRGNPFRNFSKSQDFLKIFWNFLKWADFGGNPNWHWVHDLTEIVHEVSVWAKISKKFPKISRNFPKIFKNFQILENFQKFSKNLDFGFFDQFFSISKKISRKYFCTMSTRNFPKLPKIILRKSREQAKAVKIPKSKKFDTKLQILVTCYV